MEEQPNQKRRSHEQKPRGEHHLPENQAKRVALLNRRG
jgi:hypothetical protein